MPKTKDEIQALPLSRLVQDKENARQAMDKDRLAELTASIQAKGLLQPILVRPVGDLYQVVDGHRRLEAAKEAGLAELPCMVKDLTDGEVREAQLVANLQREDLAPMDEALALKKLVDDGFGWDELAAKLGKSKSYLFHRAGLLKLSQKVQKALSDGKLQVSWAEAMVRIEKHKDQEELLHHILDGYGIDSLEDLKDAIRRDYILHLKNAPFSTKDAKLVPTAGACSACLKRSGAQGDMFGESGKADSCLDSACWAAKASAAKEALLERAKAGGVEVISGAAGKKALEGLGYRTGVFVKPSERAMPVKGNQTWAQATGGKVKEVVLLNEETGETAKVYKKAEAMAAIPPSKLEDYAKSQTPEAKAKEREETAKRKRELEIDEVALGLAAKAVHDAAGKLEAGEALALLGRFTAVVLDQCDVLFRIKDTQVEPLGVEDATDLADIILKEKRVDRFKGLLAATLYLSMDGNESLAKALKVDLKKLKAEAAKKYEEQNHKPAAKRKPKTHDDEASGPEEE